jgi:rhomboid-like protein
MLASRLTAAAARARPRLRRTLRPAKSPPHSATARRSYTNYGQGYDYSQNPVPVIGPVIWAVTAVGTIYFTCAAYDVWQDIRRFGEEDRRSLTFDKLEKEHAKQWRRKIVSQDIFTPGPIVAGSPGSVWDNLSGPSKIMAGMTLVNVGFVGLSKAPSTAARTWWASLGHTPASPWFRNSQLFTSMFAVSYPAGGSFLGPAAVLFPLFPRLTFLNLIA